PLRRAYLPISGQFPVPVHIRPTRVDSGLASHKAWQGDMSVSFCQREGDTARQLHNRVDSGVPGSASVSFDRSLLRVDMPDVQGLHTLRHSVLVAPHLVLIDDAGCTSAASDADPGGLVRL